MNKQELYMKAKEAYYAGNPIMSDEEFDNLENEVGVGAVGAVDSDAKYPHPTKMLSMSKFQADKTTGTAPTQQVNDWCEGVRTKTTVGNNYLYEVTCKYDGNSGNCIYENGKLKQVLTRGDGFKGRDITNKVRHLIPGTLPTNTSLNPKGTIEVRGEVIMKKSVFEAKYKDKFANPRNLVAGILGRDDDAMIDDLSFVAYTVKCETHDGCKTYGVSIANSLGFNADDKPFVWFFKYGQDDFDKLFTDMVAVRDKSDYPLDGFILKLDDVDGVAELGENDHDPNWAKAIKFKPVGVTTEIIDIEWNMGRTGEFIPKAILKPVDVDGSTVSRVALYNAGYVVENNITAGIKVRIAKAGDIIPQVIEIFK